MWTIITFVGFTGFVALVSWWFTRGDEMIDSDAYFLGGRTLTAWVIAGSLMLTNLSTEQLIGLNGDAFQHTIAVMAWETTAALAMVATALYFLPRYMKSGFATIPQFLGERYDEHTRVIATCLFLASYVLAILPVVLLFGATALESLFDVSDNLGLSTGTAITMMVWSIGTLGSLYAIFGGLKAVAISDTVNGAGFLVAGLLVPVLALIYVGDGSMMAGLTEVYTEEHEKFDITGDEPGSFLPFGVLFTGMIVNQVFFWCTNQSIVQRALGAKSLAEGQKGVLIAASLKLVGPLIIVLPGVIAFHMFKDTMGPEDYLQAYPTLVKTVLPPALLGFFAAVMVGAVLSTFNSVLNSSATLFSQGIHYTLINRNATGRQLVFSGRVVSIVLALAAMIAAPMLNTTGSLYVYLQKINATFFGPMLAVILLGFLTKRVPPLAAKVGLVCGPIMYFVLVFFFEENVHFLHLLAIVFLVVAAVMLVIGRLWPQDADFVQKETDDVDVTPWRYAVPAGATICVATIVCYLLLAQ